MDCALESLLGIISMLKRVAFLELQNLILSGCLNGSAIQAMTCPSKKSIPSGNLTHMRKGDFRASFLSTTFAPASE